MANDYLVYLAAGVQCLSALWGAVVSLPHSDWPQRYRWAVLTIFMLLGLLGTWATIAQARKSTEEAATSSARLRSSFDNLTSATSEIARVQNLNTELQKKLVSQSDQISALSKELLSEATGGDTFCYFTAVANEGAGTPLTYPLLVWVVGKHPMRQVSAVVQTIDEGPAEGRVLRQLNSMRVIPLGGDGTLLPGVMRISPSFRLPEGRHIISIESRRGLISETLNIKTDRGYAVQEITVSGGGKNLYRDPK